MVEFFRLFPLDFLAVFGIFFELNRQHLKADNRHEICTRLNIPFQTVDMDFDDINAVKLWMIKNQKGRRNLNDGWKYELVQVEKRIEAEIGRAKKVEAGKKYGENHPKEVLSIIDKTSEKTEYHGKECPECDFYCWETDDNCPDCGYAFIHTPEPELGVCRSYHINKNN